VGTVAYSMITGILTTVSSLRTHQQSTQVEQ
jgi:hypothetical protein